MFISMPSDWISLRQRFLRRLLWCLPVFALGFFLPPSMIPFLALLVAIIVASPLAGMVGEMFGNLFMSTDRFDKPVPKYSIAEARRRQGQPEEAIDLYREITVTHPEETRPWLSMIEIAMVELRDPARAAAYRDEALAAIRDREEREAFRVQADNWLSVTPGMRRGRN